MSNQDQHDWWLLLLAGRSKQGAIDFADGIYEPPCPDDGDPQNEAENNAYAVGWRQARKEADRR